MSFSLEDLLCPKTGLVYQKPQFEIGLQSWALHPWYSTRAGALSLQCYKENVQPTSAALGMKPVHECSLRGEESCHSSSCGSMGAVEWQLQVDCDVTLPAPLESNGVVQRARAQAQALPRMNIPFTSV